MKGDSGVQGSIGIRGSAGNVALKDLKIVLGRLVNWNLLKVKVKLEHVEKKVTRETQGSKGPRGVQGAKGLHVVANILMECKDLLVQLVCKANVVRKDTSTHDLVGEKGDRGGRGERGVKGEKGIEGDTSDVLSVLADHRPIQLATQYGEKMCFVKYHVSEDRSSIVESSGGVHSYVMLARTTNLRGILMLNLSVVKDL